MVNPSFSNKLIMTSSFLYVSSFDHDDVICFFDGLESVSDDEDSSISEECIKSLSDLFFREGIKSRGGFIQKDDLRILEKYLGNSETLFLSSTQSDSSFSYFGIKSMFEFKDEVTVSETEGLGEFLFYFLCFCYFERIGAEREIMLFVIPSLRGICSSFLEQILHTSG